MKKILFLILIILVKSLSAQNLILPKKIASVKHPLTVRDRKNYILSIKQDRIGKLHIINTDSGKFKVVDIPVRLTNKTNDTLKYVEFTCSWNSNYCTNLSVVKIEDWPCESNYPTFIVVPSKHSLTKEVPVIIPNSVKGKVEFRVGIYLNKFLKSDTNDILDDFLRFGVPHNKSVLIWSNEVGMQL